MKTVRDFIDIASQFGLVVESERRKGYNKKKFDDCCGFGQFVMLSTNRSSSSNTTYCAVYLQLVNTEDEEFDWRDAEVLEVHIFGILKSIGVKENGFITFDNKNHCWGSGESIIREHSISVPIEHCTEEIFRRCLQIQISPQTVILENFKNMSESIPDLEKNVYPLLEEFGFTYTTIEPCKEEMLLGEYTKNLSLFRLNNLVPSILWANEFNDYVIIVLNPITSTLEIWYIENTTLTDRCLQDQLRERSFFNRPLSEFKDWLSGLLSTSPTLKYKYLFDSSYPIDSHNKVAKINDELLKFIEDIRQINDIEAAVKKLKKLKDDLLESGVPVDDPVLGGVEKGIEAVSFALSDLYSGDCVIKLS